MEDKKSIAISAEVTPNPNTLKFSTSLKFFESGSLNYTDKEKAKESYLATELFGIDQVLGVHIGTTFVTITKVPAAEWQPLIPGIVEKLKEVLSSGKTLFPEQVKSPTQSQEVNSLEDKIRQVIDTEIRPAVAMDGGDILFEGYEDGIVTLHLQGACSSCPSSVMTLKMGIENRLKSLFPEVKEVVQV